jgi:signal transduction histidine kinase
VVEAVRPTIEGLARAGEIEAVFAVEPPLPVRGDPVRLREVLLNLADNAVKYTPPRGRIVLSAARAVGTVEVSVSDSGIGIPSEVGDRIFEPFFVVKGTAPHHGQASTGLGLALARRLIEAHGGTISYTSDVTKGTTFRFTLPGAAPEAVAAAASKTGRRRERGGR